jgi:polar amino acid transport system substrate-binding protein
MNDGRLNRWLEPVGEPLRPGPDFDALLYGAIADELDFPRPHADPAIAPRWDRRQRPRSRTRWDLLMVAAIVMILGAGLLIVPGALRNRAQPTVAPSSLLAAIRSSGRIRIAVRPDYPQVKLAKAVTQGFDIDVARELASRLGVTAEIVLLDPATMLSPAGRASWDAALPSVAAWTVPQDAFAATRPYYAWQHFLVVSSSSSAQLADVVGGPVCAVGSDAGAAWLEGTYEGGTATPMTTRVLTRASDDECIAALASGAAVAAVTADLSDADLQVRDDIRVIGGPPREPRVVIVSLPTPGAADPGDLLRALDDAVRSMRADGTLARLSQSRFGGVDLTP